ncbi:MAG: hypothetical protein LBV58_04980 [Acholeplasmatales bacterium]|nr:hypothetical protein [Acholeplasmatales bacterium]
MAQDPKKPKRIITKFLIPLIVKFGLSSQPNTQTIDPAFYEVKKGQFLMLINHMQFLDFFVQFKNLNKVPINNIVNLDAYQILPYWLMELGGCIPKRKFSRESTSIRSMKHVVDRGGNVGVFPEARYTMVGRTSILPDSLGKFIKLLNIPVIVQLNHGHHLVNPTWGNQKKRKLPVHCEVKVVLTKDEIEALTVNEINERVRSSFVYDEYEWQLENKILIKEKYRAVGLEKILYKCPHCLDEHSISSKDTLLTCSKCGAIYELNENGTLSSLNGETKFSKVLDWCDWERETVREEIRLGTYRFEETMETWAFPHPKNLIKVPNAKVVHDLNGFRVEGNYNGYDYVWTKTPLENYSVQIEYSWPNKKYKDGSRANIFAIHTSNDGLYFLPKDSKVLYKISLAVEELYRINSVKGK